MKRYPKYKDSGIPWIGKIPAHWEVKKLKYCINKIESGKRENTNKEEIYSIGGEHVGTDGKIHLDNPKYISKKFFDNYRKGKVKKNDILIVKDGATIGKTAFIDFDPENKMMVNEHVYRIEASKYYYYFFLSHYFQQIIWKENQSSAQEGLPLSTILNIPSFYIPSLNEQTAIADYLDRKTAEIDDLIAKKERLLELYGEEKKAIINKAVTKGLNPNVKMKDSGIPWLGEIPEHWEVKKLKYVGDIIIGVTYRPTDVVKDNSQGILVLRASNIQNGKLDLNDCVYISMDIPEYLKLRNGDILICSRSGSKDLIGKNILIDNEISGDTFGAFMTVFRPKNQNYKFIYYFFNSQVFDSQSSLYSTVTINQLTITILKNITIVLPPLSKQQQIVSYIEVQLSSIDSKIEKTKKMIELLKEYKISLISEVVTGKKKVVN